MKNYRQLTLTLSFVLIFYGTVNSQEIPVAQLSESDFFSDLPVVLTATRLKQPQKNAPIASTIIDREMIEASGFTEIADLLRLAPNMIVNYDSGRVPAVGYSYLFDRYTVRMQVLIDGRSVYTPIFGEMYWTNLGISVDDIERIEVIRGPSSSSYGPNAMSGVISIITKHANIDKGASFKILSGKNGIQEHYFHNADNIGDLSYRLSLTTRKNDGFEERFDDMDLHVINLKTNYQINNNNEFELNVAYNSGEFGNDDVFSDDDFNDNPNEHVHPPHDQSITNKSYQVKWIHTFDNNDSLSVNFYEQEHDDRNDYIGTYDVGGPVPIRTNASIYSNRHNLEIEHQVNSDHFNLVWGGIYRTDKTIAPLYLYGVDDNKVKTSQYYINSTFNLNDDNILYLGYLYDKNDIAGTTHSTRLSYNYHINDSHTLRASYATSTRTPFIFEERTNYYFEDIDSFLGTLQFTYGLAALDFRDLSAEETDSYDIGLVSYLNNKTNLDVRIYNNEYRNLVYIDDFSVDYGIGPVRHRFFDNGEGFHIKGIETSINHKFNKGWIRLNYAHNETYNPTVIDNSEEYFKSGTPNDIASLITAYYLSDSLTMNLNYYYTSEMQQVLSERLQESQDRFDLRLAKSFRIGKSDAKASLMIFNITNNEYIVEFRPDRFTPNGLGRSGYISFKMDF